MYYVVFDTKAQAEAELESVNQRMGYPQESLNALTGLPTGRFITSSWDSVRQRNDGRWCFNSPPIATYTGELQTYDPAWFVEEGEEEI